MAFSFGSDASFLRSIRRHFVSFGGTLNDLDANGIIIGDERPFCCSAFVIEIRGVWCLMTAGHVFQELDDGIKDGKIRLLKCGLGDYFSAEAKHKEPVPFAYDAEHRITVLREDAGVDFALIPLRPYYRNLIAANGVVPMPVAVWDGRSPPPFAEFALLGLPDEGMSPMERQGERGPQIGHAVTLTLVGVQALPAPLPEHVLSPIPRFAGILCDNDSLASAVGMSGGPIIGVNPRAPGKWDYACVAVQGSWLESKRMIFGTPASIVTEAIAKLLPAEPG